MPAAKSTATELAESAFRLIPVCSRTSRPVLDRSLESLPQRETRHFRLLGRFQRLLHLAEDLAFPDDHRLQAAGHPEKVSRCIHAPQMIDVLEELAIGGVQHRPQELRRRSLAAVPAGDGIDFRPITGRQDYGLRHMNAQKGQRISQLPAANRRPLAYRQRGRLMI